MGNWDYGIFWKETLNQLKNELSEQEFAMWFNMEYETSGELSVVVSVPSAFYRDQVKQRYQAKIEAKLFELSGQHIMIDLEVKHRKKSESPAVHEESHAQPDEDSSPRAVRQSASPKRPEPVKAEREGHSQLRKDTHSIISSSARITRSPPTPRLRSPETRVRPITPA